MPLTVQFILLRWRIFLNSPELDPFVGSNSIAYVMPEELSVDIDNENDWFIAEQLMRKIIG